MNPHRLFYRASQFWRALHKSPPPANPEEILSFLTKTQLTLFQQMQPSEQVHAVGVMSRLRADGRNDPDLMTAALLHDVGKSIHPLTLIERVEVVMGKKLMPDLVKRLGQGEPRGLRKPFVVAVKHAEWGAELASRAGASLRAVNLIRCHQDPCPEYPATLEDRLLAALQQADDSN